MDIIEASDAITELAVRFATRELSTYEFQHKVEDVLLETRKQARE